MEKEIEWWFGLYNDYNRTNNIRINSQLYIKKPLVISLYEFAKLLKYTIKQINVSVKKIAEIYESANRNKPVPFIERKYKKNANFIEKRLKGFRNQIAAHRYKEKDDKFLIIEDVVENLMGVKWSSLSEYKTMLLESNKAIEDWIDNNKDQLILLLHKNA